jgi:hypothetical protein
MSTGGGGCGSLHGWQLQSSWLACLRQLSAAWCCLVLLLLLLLLLLSTDTCLLPAQAQRSENELGNSCRSLMCNDSTRCTAY